MRPVACFERLGHDVDVAHAREQQHTVAQILAVQQYVDGEDNDDEYLAQRLEDRSGNLRSGLELVRALAHNLTRTMLSGAGPWPAASSRLMSSIRLIAASREDAEEECTDWILWWIFVR